MPIKLDSKQKYQLSLAVPALSGLLLAMGSIPVLNIGVAQPILGAITLGQVMGGALLVMAYDIYTNR